MSDYLTLLEILKKEGSNNCLAGMKSGMMMTEGVWP